MTSVSMMIDRRDCVDKSGPDSNEIITGLDEIFFMYRCFIWDTHFPSEFVCMVFFMVPIISLFSSGQWTPSGLHAYEKMILQWRYNRLAGQINSRSGTSYEVFVFSEIHFAFFIAYLFLEWVVYAFLSDQIKSNV